MLQGQGSKDTARWTEAMAQHLDAQGAFAPGSRAGRSSFSATAWSVIAGAQAPDAEVSRACLERLIERYWRPVYSFVRSRGHSNEDAKDVTQAFFTRFLERRIVAYADPGRGRFRNFLLAAVKQYLAGEGRLRARRPHTAPVEDIDRAAAYADFGAGRGLSPERVFMRNWTKALLENSLARLEAECAAVGREMHYRAFAARYLSGAGEAESRRSIALSLGISETDVRNYLARARKRFRRILLEEVSNSVFDGGDALAELGEMLSALAD